MNNTNMLALADFKGMDENFVKAKIANDFGIPEEHLEGCTLIVAYMSVGSYGCDSAAFVVFEKEGNLYEVNASHCSCYGFSESDYSGDTRTQWKPEAVEDVQAILQRSDWGLAAGGYDDDQAANAAAIRKTLRNYTAN